MAPELRATVPSEGLARVFVERERGGVAVVDVGGVDLGDGDEDAQLVDAGDAEEFLGGTAGGGGAGVDEVADVGVALGDDAAVGGVDLLKGLQLFEAADVGLGGLHGGALGGGAGDGDVGLLLGDGVQLEEILIALGGGVGEVEVGLRALEVGARDLQLFVELGGLDGGHELALGDVLADVHEPLLEVAAGAGVDGRVVVGLGVAGELDLGGRAGDGGVDDADDGDFAGAVADSRACSSAKWPKMR
jgi:hypothetical protein